MTRVDPVAAEAPQPRARLRVAVWDGFVRTSHWVVFVGVVIAWFSHGGLLAAHRIAGYVVAAFIFARLAWGFVGGRYARFAGFVPHPARLVAYLGALLRRREPRFIGHNPAGGAMIVILLAALIAISTTGFLIDTPGWRDYRPLREWHAALSDVLMVLVIVHVLGVLYASVRHRENLVGSMFTGSKERRETDGASGGISSDTARASAKESS